MYTVYTYNCMALANFSDKLHAHLHYLWRVWASETQTHIDRDGQDHVYTVYIRYVWQGKYKIYGHIRCIYTVLANPTHWLSCTLHQCKFGSVQLSLVIVFASPLLTRVGQNHTYTVYLNCFRQGNHQKYGHVRCSVRWYVYTSGQPYPW